MRRLTVLISLVVMLDLGMWFAILPLLPGYAEDLDLSKFESGLLVASYSIAVVVLSVPVGHFADRLGPRSFTVAGSLLMAVATAVFALQPGFWLLLAARFVQGLCSSISWSAGLAWLSASAPAERRGRVIAIANAAATGGTIAGPLLGGPVADRIGVETTFMIVAAFSALLGLWGLFEPPPPATEASERDLRPALAASTREPLIGVSLLVIMLVAGVTGVVQTLATLELDAGGIGQDDLGILFAGAAALGAAAIIITGRIGDRRGRPQVAFWDCLLLAGATGLFMLPLGAAAVAALFLLFWPIQSVLYGVGYPLSTDGADRAGVGHGLVLGLVNLVWGVGAAVGPVAGGAAADVAGDGLSYASAALACLVTALLIHRMVMAPGPQARARGPDSRAAR